ncbi:exopolygalacturonase-like [Triticum dicoccoides]|uniref:exopolygalacturonase-like n=1 Tax=Triticum dicoccoides TaxID=85692 RepID=UPI00188F2907|nr:exopolygalacturonase-like [Triticum dicoccoides]
MEARPPVLAIVVVALCVVSLCGGVAHGTAVTYNVKNYGAKGNGATDDTKALMAAWKVACAAAGAVTLQVPAGVYYMGPAQFHGPCKASSLTFLLQASKHAPCSCVGGGTLKAATDLSRFGNDWIEFGWVKGLIVAGQNGAAIDGQGAASWPFNKCPIRKDCKVLPTSVLFVNNENTVVKDISSVNSKFFHFALLQNKNTQMINLRINAPGTSPNTDGVHIERCSGVTIVDTKISTGDDCISIGQGNDNIDIQRVTCGPGHGMSVGSLGRYVGEGDVTRVHVKDMTFEGTMNGVRIKTWENSPTKSLAAHMVFESLVMKDVQNPVIIDQKYCPYYNCEHKYVSGVTIKNVTFKNIKGTSSLPVAVLLRCGMPCQGVVLQDLDLKFKGAGTTSSKCENAKAKYVGYMYPKPCV